MHYRSSSKVLIILVRFLKKFNFLQICEKKFQISSIMKVCPVGAELFHADGQTDKTDTAKLIVPFRTSVNAPKMHL